jgi:RNA polymerase sigma factor (sigma-70 family)
MCRHCAIDYRVLPSNGTMHTLGMLTELVTPVSDLARAAFRDHRVVLQRFLIRRVGHPQDADDLAQEVFARLLRVRNVELVRQPLAYLLGIATNVVREFIQRKRSERVLYDSNVADNMCEISECVTQADLAERLDLQERLDRALTQLPPTHMLVLLLVKRDGLSYAEAALAAGLSVHTIEKYVVEARASLRVMLRDIS